MLRFYSIAGNDPLYPKYKFSSQISPSVKTHCILLQLNIAKTVSADFTNKTETKEPCKIKAILQAVLKFTSTLEHSDFLPYFFSNCIYTSTSKAHHIHDMYTSVYSTTAQHKKGGQNRSTKKKNHLIIAKLCSKVLKLAPWYRQTPYNTQLSPCRCHS